MSNKLLSIIGPTAVGKTSFVLQLVNFLNKNSPNKIDKKLNKSITFNGYDLISADSRQVYKDLMIISGADIPPDFVRKNSDVNYENNDKSYFQKDNIRLFGLLDLDYLDEWSLAHFKKFAQQLIVKAWSENRLPIIVGGTGLYHDHLFNDSSQIWIKPNLKLRDELSQFSLIDLQKKLKEISQKKFDQMNNSDQNNPVRLIRAIEVESSENIDLEEKEGNNEKPSYDHLIIGLIDELLSIEARIKERVKKRFNNGAIAEVENLMLKIEELGLNKQITTATGVREIRAYLDGQIDKQECLEKWSLREYQYAKRQLTWWKNKKNINWYKIRESHWKEKAFTKVNEFILPVQN